MSCSSAASAATRSSVSTPPSCARRTRRSRARWTARAGIAACAATAGCRSPTRPAPRPATRPAHDEIELPLRGKPLRDKIVLRAIAVDRALHFLILAALALGVLLVAGNEVDLRDKFYAVLGALHGGLGGPTDDSDGGFVDGIDDFLNLPADKLKLIAAALAAYALLQAPRGSGCGCRGAGPSTSPSLDLGVPADRDLRARRPRHRAEDRGADRQHRDPRLPAVREAPLRPPRRRGGRRGAARARPRVGGPGRERARGDGARLSDSAAAGPGGGDLGDVPVVGAAAAAEHIHPRQPLPERRVAGAEVGRIAVVELRRLVELGVAHGRGVRAQAADPLDPGLAGREHRVEVGRVGAVEHHVVGPPGRCGRRAP